MQETLAVLRYRHFMFEAIERDMDDAEISAFGKTLKKEKNRLRDERVRTQTN